MGRRQLAWLEVSPYQRGLLERGLNRRVRGEYPDRRMEQGMGYSAAIGTMLVDEIARFSARVEEKHTGVRTDLGKVEAELVRAHDWSRDVGEKMEALERQNRQLLASRTAMRDDIAQMNRSIDGLLQVNLRMAEAIVQLRVSQVHNQNNPIVIDDDLSDEDTIAEVVHVPEGICLIPIEEVADSEEEESSDEEEIWEISRKEFEDEVVDTRGESPEL